MPLSFSWFSSKRESTSRPFNNAGWNWYGSERYNDALGSGKGRGDGTKKKWEEEERRDLASSRLTNCKYLDCGCRMTLINIANGTECRRRNEEVRPSPRAGYGKRGKNCKETVVGYTRVAAARGRRRGEGVLWVFIISSSRLDSVKLWNNPLMSPPCRVDRMPTRHSDFSLFYRPALSFSMSLVSPSLYSLPFIFLLPSLSYTSFHFFSGMSPTLLSSLSAAWSTLRSWLL